MLSKATVCLFISFVFTSTFDTSQTVNFTRVLLIDLELIRIARCAIANSFEVLSIEIKTDVATRFCCKIKNLWQIKENKSFLSFNLFRYFILVLISVHKVGFEFLFICLVVMNC